MIASGEDSPEALSGFVKFHPQYPVLKVPGGACGPPCASRSRLARGCILRASPPRVKGKFGFGRNYSGAREDSAGPSGFPQLAQSLPRGPCRPSLWRSLHNLFLAAQSFRDSRDKGFAFHGASSAAWAKAPAVPLDWPISAVASAIDQGRPAGRWPACRPFHRSGDAVAEIAGEEGASEPAADPRRPAKRFSRGRSRVPEPRGAHAAQRRMRHRPAAPPGAWVGLAATPPSSPPTGPRRRGPSIGGRLRQAADAGVREPAAAESGSAPIPSTAFAPPSGGCLPRANRPLRARRGRGGQAPNASPPRCGSPRCARTGPARPPRARRRRARPGLAMPMGGEGALSARALEWAGESGRTRKGRRPAPTPLNETRFLSYKPFPSYGPGSKKEGPAVSGGPLGYPWWSLGGSNP